MKPIIRLTSILTMLIASTVLLHAATDVVTVAVFDFESKDDAATHKLGPQIATMIAATLSTDPKINTVERAELQKALGEQELGLSGTVSPDTAAKVGQLTGAKVLVTGRAFKIDQKLVIVAKIISAETSRVFGEMIQGNPSDVADLSAQLAKKISKTINDKTDALVAKVVSRDERIDRLVKKLKGDKHPVIAVRISEQHYGARAIDPAAQTEFLYILKQAGFTVVDEKSDRKPDIEITGEGFSAFALRKGNLVSCRSRIELKAQERTTGKILAIDRQTGVAVDVSEQTAGKTALQNAADELAERLLPKLAKQ